MSNYDDKAKSMKNTANKAIERTYRLEKGYKTRLKKILKNKHTGLQYVAGKTGMHRQTVATIRDTGRANRTNKEKIEKFIDQHTPPKKLRNGRRNKYETTNTRRTTHNVNDTGTGDRGGKGNNEGDGTYSTEGGSRKTA